MKIFRTCTYRVSKLINFRNKCRGTSTKRFLCSRLQTAYQTCYDCLFFCLYFLKLLQNFILLSVFIVYYWLLLVYAVKSVAMPWLRQLVTGLSLWRPGFTPRSVHVGFVVGKMHWDRFFSVSIIPPWLSILIYHLVDQHKSHCWWQFRDIVPSTWTAAWTVNALKPKLV
jgi:hypothetical protein